MIGPAVRYLDRRLPLFFNAKTIRSCHTSKQRDFYPRSVIGITIRVMWDQSIGLLSFHVSIHGTISIPLAAGTRCFAVVWCGVFIAEFLYLRSTKVILFQIFPSLIYNHFLSRTTVNRNKKGAGLERENSRVSQLLPDLINLFSDGRNHFVDLRCLPKNDVESFLWLFLLHWEVVQCRRCFSLPICIESSAKIISYWAKDFFRAFWVSL